MLDAGDQHHPADAVVNARYGSVNRKAGSCYLLFSSNLQEDHEPASPTPAIAQPRLDEVLKAREQVLAIAQKVGMPVDGLFAGSAKFVKKEKGQKVNPKYQDPADKSQTWTGRGRQPKCIAQGTAKGKSLNEFLI